MFVGEDTDPRADRDNREHGRDPAWRERLCKQGRATRERGATGDQQREHQRERQRFLVVKSFEQRGHDANHQECASELIRGIETSCEGPAEDQQTRTNNARRKM